MRERRIEKNLRKKELEELLNEMKAKADSFSIVRYYDDYMTLDEYQSMQDCFQNKILGDHEKRILDYQKNNDGYQDELNILFHFHSQEEAMDYFNDLFHHEMDVYKSCQYCEFEDMEKENLRIPNEFVVKRRLTRISPLLKRGPAFEVLTLTMDVFDDIILAMKKLFSPYKVFGYEFEDLSVYKDEQLIFSINTDENYAIIYDYEDNSVL